MANNPYGGFRFVMGLPQSSAWLFQQECHLGLSCGDLEQRSANWHVENARFHGFSGF